MSDAATTSVLPNTPDRAATTVPERVGRLLVLVRWLITYGTHLAAALRQDVAAPRFRLAVQTRFGTADFARILARIASGLRLALALEARLDAQAATGKDLRTITDWAPSPQQAHSAQPAARAARRASPAGPAARGCPEDGLPSAADIAAQVRRRPIGAVIAEICRDLGITPGMLTPEQWVELSDTIIRFGGNIARFVRDLLGRIPLPAAELANGDAPGLLASPAPLRIALTGTGPP